MNVTIKGAVQMEIILYQSRMSVGKRKIEAAVLAVQRGFDMDNMAKNAKVESLRRGGKQKGKW